MTKLPRVQHKDVNSGFGELAQQVTFVQARANTEPEISGTARDASPLEVSPLQVG